MPVKHKRSRKKEELLQNFRKSLMKKQGTLSEVMEDILSFSKDNGFRCEHYFGLYALYVWFVDESGGCDAIGIPYDRFVGTAPEAEHHRDPYEVRAHFKLRNYYAGLTSTFDLDAAKKLADDLLKYFPGEIIGAAVVDLGVDINYQIQEIIYEATA